MNSQFRKLLEKRVRLLLIVWIVLLLSNSFIVVISYITNKNFIPIKSLPEILLSPTSLILTVASLVVFIFSLSLIQLLIRKKLPASMDKEALIEVIKAKQIRNESTLSSDEEALLKNLSFADVKTFNLFISYLPLFITRLALAEAITLLGLQISMIQQSFQVILPFFVLSIIIFLAKIPTLETVYFDLQKALRTN